MQGWQHRLMDEREELSSKLKRLEQFLADESNWKDIPVKEVALLITQSYAMHQYLDILDVRLTYVKD